MVKVSSSMFLAFLAVLLLGANTAAAGPGVVSTLAVETVVELSGDRANDLEWSADGKVLAIAGSEGVWIWSSSEAQEAPLQVASEGANSVALSPDGGTILVARNDGTVALRRLPDGKVLGTLNGHSQAVNSVAISSDGSLAASGGSDATVRLWDMETLDEKHKLERHVDEVQAVAFSPDGKRLASAGFDTDHSAILWDLEDRTEPRTLVVDDFAMHVAFSPDGSILAVGGEDGLSFWSTETGEEDLSLDLETPGWGGVAFSPAGGLFAVANTFRGSVALLDTASGVERARLRPLEGASLSDLAFSPDGSLLALAAENFGVWIYRLHEVEAREISHGAEIWSLAASPTAEVVAVGGLDQVDLHSIESGERVGESRSAGRAIAFAPDGELLATAAEGEVHLSRVEDGTEVAVLGGGTAAVTTLAFDPLGRFLAAADSDDRVRLWEIGTGEELAVLEGSFGHIASMTIAPDGSYLALGGAADVHIQRLDASARPAPGSRRLEFDHRAFGLDVSSDGEILAAASAGGIGIWRMRGTDRGGSPLWANPAPPLRGHAGDVYSVAFSADASALYSSGQDGTVRVWDVESGIERLSLHPSRRPNHIVTIRGLAVGSDLIVAGDNRGSITIWRLSDLP